MARAPMNAVRDKMVCSRTSEEARMVNRIVGGISTSTGDAKLGLHKHAYVILVLFSSRRLEDAHLNATPPLLTWHGRASRFSPGRGYLYTIMPSSSADTSSTIPITVFTGFLGAGKTSVILSLLPQLPKGYRVVLLKNEFGDIEGH